MSRWRLLAILTLATLSLPSSVLAQICRGGTPLAGVSSGNFGGGASFFDGGKTFGASATFGSQFFGTGAFAYTDFDDTDLSLKNLAGLVGFEVSPSGSQASICPTASVGYGFGLEVLGVDITTVTFAPSVAAGFVAEVSPTVAVVPSAEIALLYQRLTADAGPLGETTESETDGALALAVSLLFKQRVSVGPSVYIPIASDGGDTVFGVGIAIAVGGGS
jgi:hypothetical protein